MPQEVKMAQAVSQSTTRRVGLRTPKKHLATDTSLSGISLDPRVVSGPDTLDPIFAAIEAHKSALDQRNQTIEALCAAEERQKAEEREIWQRYEAAAITLLTTKPTTTAGIIALMAYVGLPECSGPGKSESILDGARLSSNEEAAAAAERFPMLSAEALSEITGERVQG
jgi:hypothetical protein